MSEVALITGGARGLGRAMVDDLAGDFDVAFTYNTSAPSQVMKAHPQALSVQADLSDPTSATAVIDAVIAQFGRLDVIVNNAGFVAPTPADATDFADHSRTFAVNVISPMALLSAALPHLNRGARIINISSTNAQLPARGASAYSASKAALDCWTRAMAKELGPLGIRVNAVAPGATERTESPRPQDLIDLFVEMTALGRIGEPEDVARVVRFLATPASQFITGEIVNVNGGYRL